MNLLETLKKMKNSNPNGFDENVNRFKEKARQGLLEDNISVEDINNAIKTIEKEELLESYASEKAELIKDLFETSQVIKDYSYLEEYADLSLTEEEISNGAIAILESVLNEKTHEKFRERLKDKVSDFSEDHDLPGRAKDVAITAGVMGGTAAVGAGVVGGSRLINKAKYNKAVENLKNNDATKDIADKFTPDYYKDASNFTADSPNSPSKIKDEANKSINGKIDEIEAQNKTYNATLKAKDDYGKKYNDLQKANAEIENSKTLKDRATATNKRDKLAKELDGLSVQSKPEAVEAAEAGLNNNAETLNNLKNQSSAIANSKDIEAIQNAGQSDLVHKFHNATKGVQDWVSAHPALGTATAAVAGAALIGGSAYLIHKLVQKIRRRREGAALTENFIYIFDNETLDIVEDIHTLLTEEDIRILKESDEVVAELFDEADQRIKDAKFKERHNPENFIVKDAYASTLPSLKDVVSTFKNQPDSIESRALSKATSRIDKICSQFPDLKSLMDELNDECNKEPLDKEKVKQLYNQFVSLYLHYKGKIKREIKVDEKVNKIHNKAARNKLMEDVLDISFYDELKNLE